MSFGRSITDWETRINVERMRKERLSRLLRAAKDFGYEALLLLHGDNQRYAGHSLGKAMTQGANGFRFMIVPVNSGQPILYEYGMWRQYIRDNVDWMEVRTSPSFVAQGPKEAREKQLRKAASAIKMDLKNFGLSSEKLMVDVYNFGIMNTLRTEGVDAQLGAVDCTTEARSIKTRDEVECLRVGSAITESGFQKLSTLIRPGISETQLRGAFVGEMYDKGMEYIPSGEINSGPRTYVNNVTTSDRTIRHGDIIIAMACQSSFMGYRVCYYRTFVCGRANQDQKDTYARTRDYTYDAIKIVKPGVTTKDIAELWPTAREFGYESEDEALWVQWGHGIGLSIPEEPTASRLWSLETPQVLKDGMTIALETWLPTKERNGTYPRGQSARIEEMMQVTGGGADLISRYPSDELIECTN
jgi:Xaa-Pro aminopeptidase